ncbi:decaprenyl-phosphate phosphoribosyltransferase [Pseudomonas sp. 8 R 14]|uniref:decaprenyl-phosphate phosphoribosyltransferase n=1 Tax=Pseudomonas sp. 8 R 14 TaxID=1844092 RepID=UPI0008125023|nr:decaprenyl-phosphate phosphoribosyltransferase [Pseudomonas sp. 8 R 14]CRM72204.1 Decaprenyl-phosphate phosphoribosyltransferase [Pseudomonas sp. 8 R 14]
MFKDLLRLARPYQYSKNLFIFIPAFFDFQLTNANLMLEALTAFVGFSLIASAVYIFNDWIDRHEDALHPEKKNRPLAAGRIKTRLAFVMLALLMVGGVSAALLVSPGVFFLILTYLAVNFAYTLKLKHIAIIDIVIIASGFVIRLLVGAEATQVSLSHWIIVMTFLLALFLSLAKRRDDVMIYLKTDKKMRKVIDGYNLKFLDAAMVMSASIVVVAYILWSISPDVAERLNTQNIYLSAVFVVLGIMRYMQIAFVEEKSGNPSKVLLKDRFIQLTLLGWVSVFVWFIYLS